MSNETVYKGLNDSSDRASNTIAKTQLGASHLRGRVKLVHPRPEMFYKRLIKGCLDKPFMSPSMAAQLSQTGPLCIVKKGPDLKNDERAQFQIHHSRCASRKKVCTYIEETRNANSTDCN